MNLTEGEAIILEVVRVTSRSRTTHMGEFVLIFVNAVVKQICRDCGVEHEVSMEKPTVSEWERRESASLICGQAK